MDNPDSVGSWPVIGQADAVVVLELVAISDVELIEGHGRYLPE
jgi:hypothetical protein